MWPNGREEARLPGFLAAAVLKRRFRALKRAHCRVAFTAHKRTLSHLERLPIAGAHFESRRLIRPRVLSHKKTRAYERYHYEHRTERHARENSKSCTEQRALPSQRFPPRAVLLPRSLLSKWAAGEL